MTSTRRLAVTTFLCVAAGAAFGHDGSAAASGLASGFAHPFLGLDHLLAMVAVGLWAAWLGRPALWALPVAFPLAMAGGGALAFAGVALPGVELGIAASLLVLGALVALQVRMRAAVAAVVVAAFAVLHGHAHGSELPVAASAGLYAAGFVVATALLHGLGIGLALGARRVVGPLAVRALGAAIAAAGTAWLFVAA